MPSQKKRRWFVVLLVQAGALGVVSAVFAFSSLLYFGAPEIAGVIQNIYAWGILQASAAYSAYKATRVGLNNYIAWIAPPVLYAALPWALVGFPPEVGPMFLCTLLAIVGAAAGDVKNKLEQKNQRSG